MGEKNGPTTPNIKLDADQFEQELRPVFLANIRMKYKNMLALAHFLNPQIKIRCLTGWYIILTTYSVIGLITETAG